MRLNLSGCKKLNTVAKIIFYPKQDQEYIEGKEDDDDEEKTKPIPMKQRNSSKGEEGFHGRVATFLQLEPLVSSRLTCSIEELSGSTKFIHDVRDLLKKRKIDVIKDQGAWIGSS